MLVVTVVAGLLGGRFLVAGGDGGQARTARPAAGAGAGTAVGGEVARLQAELRRRPGEPRLLTQLGVAYVARARETADPTFYVKAAGVLTQAAKLDPGGPTTMSPAACSTSAATTSAPPSPGAPGRPGPTRTCPTPSG